MICVLGSIRVRDDDVSRLKPALVRHVNTTRAEAGCDHYALAHDVIDPAVIQVSERWVDQVALGAHLVGDPMVRFSIDLRAAKILSACVDSYHPGGEVRKLIDVNVPGAKYAKDSRQVVIVMGTARFLPGVLAPLSGVLQAQIESTRAEDGCDHYAFACDAIDPDVLQITERWRDHDALRAHFAAPHMAAFNTALASAKPTAISVKAYDATGVRVLMGE